MGALGLIDRAFESSPAAKQGGLASCPPRSISPVPASSRLHPASQRHAGLPFLRAPHTPAGTRSYPPRVGRGAPRRGLAPRWVLCQPPPSPAPTARPPSHFPRPPRPRRGPPQRGRARRPPPRPSPIRARQPSVPRPPSPRSIYPCARAPACVRQTAAGSRPRSRSSRATRSTACCRSGPARGPKRTLSCG